MSTPTIVGAGPAGLIAAHAWPSARVVEVSPEPVAAHQALLRFRSDAVARVTAIDFRRVLVRKAMWSRGEFRTPSIAHANAYEGKVLSGGTLRGERSLWNLDPVERWIAPPDFHARCLANVGDRISWGKCAMLDRGDLLVSTAPMPTTLQALHITIGGGEFFRAPIHVARFEVPNADLYQTVYFPDPELSIYRASITGSTMIVEATSGSFDARWDLALRSAFGISPGKLLGTTEQRYGKIVPLRESLRKPLLFDLSHRHNIFSLGRFATWRNILLDDVVQDISVIKRLIAGNSAYDARRAST